MLLAATTSLAQPVPRQAVVEHFTNTLCSVCASRNPGMFQTVSGIPQLMHIAYYPSAPYPACQLNQHNKVENDSRTNFYNIYGGTPRIVVQGKVIPANTSYSDASLYQNELNQMSSFDVRTEVKVINSNMFNVHIVVKKVDASNASSLSVYGAIVEDTVFYKGPNGEPEHYNVFRKALWNTSLPIASLINVNDSIEENVTVILNSAWNASRMYAVALLQDGNKQILQAAKSEKLAASLSIQSTNTTNNAFTVYPVPASNTITVNGKVTNKTAEIYTLSGRKMMETGLGEKSTELDISSLPAGVYILKVAGNASYIVKQ